jgi:GMP synthase (glutamine-hydrolysing)
MVKNLAVIDFGSKYTAFIHRSLEKLGFNFEKYEVTTENPEGRNVFDEIRKNEWLGIILSGSKDNLYNSDARRLPREFIGYIIQNRIPTLGICYGHQLLVHLSNGDKITLNPKGFEKGHYTFTQTRSGFPLFKDLPERFKVKMHHHDVIESLPENFINFGETAKTQFAAIQLSQNGEKFPIFGIQLHPEKSFRHINRTIFTNFYEICIQKSGTGALSDF